LQSRHGQALRPSASILAPTLQRGCQRQRSSVACADATLERQGRTYAGAWEQEQFAAAQVYVLPSYREGTPRTVLEAMAMGRPIVTTDVPGCRETVVEGVNGFLVPVRDDAALGRAMERLILKPGLAERMGAESLRIAREKFEVHKVNAAILKAMGLD